jgi:2-polyprenyl-3-methyl-5-hydroxy-6-metoxy-1,4-benzoquinol methylase
MAARSFTLEACLLCGSSALVRDEWAEEALNLQLHHGVVQCSDCSLRFLSPRPRREEYIEAYSTGTGSLIAEYGPIDGFYVSHDELRQGQYRIRLQHLQRALPPGGRVLEIGASSGRFLASAQKAGFVVTGIEPSVEARREALKRHALDFLPLTVDQAEFQPSSFDAVVSSHVFEHLLEPLMVAKKVEAWLSPGGVHILEVPNQWESVGARLRRAGLIQLEPRSRSFTSIHHTIFFSPRTLKELARRSGLEPVRVRKVHYARPGHLNLLKRTASGLVGAPVIELTARKPE